MRLVSATRQVILGIGAHRQADGRKGQTWWFILTHDEPMAALDLATTDDAGHGLDREAFEDANAGFGAELVVFRTWEAYRSFAAQEVYGFDSGETLGRLANAYRLLASPILSGGSARFAPIPAALRDAQEPIDLEQIIRPLAESHRELNRMKAMQQRLHDATRALTKLRDDLFWGNLNALRIPKVRDYQTAANALATATDKKRQAEATQVALTKQLKLVTTELAKLDDQLRELRTAQAVQAQLQQQRKQLQQLIKQNQQQLARYRKLEQAVTQAKTDLATVVSAGERLKADEQALRTGQLAGIDAQLHGQSSGRPALSAALAQTQLADTVQALRDYLQTYRQALQRDEQLTQLITQSSTDVGFVQGMQGEMKQAIDHRATGLAARANAGLQADNQTIHEAGAAKMSAVASDLLQEQATLIKTQPDLKVYLADDSALPTLAALSQQFQVVVDQLAGNLREQETNRIQAEAKTTALATLTAQLADDGDPAQVQAAIDAATAQLGQLQLDETVGTRLAAVQDQWANATARQRDFDNQLTAAQTVSAAQAEIAAQNRQLLATLTTELTAALSVLNRFAPEAELVADIPALVALEHSHHVRIDKNPALELSKKISNTIAGTNSQGYDENQALDRLFELRGHQALASALHQDRTVAEAGLTILPIDINEALATVAADEEAVTKAVAELATGNRMALTNYLTAAVTSVDRQYKDVAVYNDMLTSAQTKDGIRLRLSLLPLAGNATAAVEEINHTTGDDFPLLTKYVESKVEQLVDDNTLADDDEAFIEKAAELLDTRQWSQFQVEIFRRHSDVPEVVDDAFVQSGGSGAEKAQAMVLPLLLVPKMRLARATKPDAPHLVMFDEFADKLDPDTARVFVKTIAKFGFNFIATMPTGGENKILADGVSNMAYEVLSTKKPKKGEFHPNQLQRIVSWQAQDNA